MNKLGEALDSYLQKIGLQEQIKQRKWLQKWPEIVGSHINRYTRPLVLKKGTLWIEVSDSSWLYHLTTLQEKIRTDFNNFAGFAAIKKIKFVNVGDFEPEEEKPSGLKNFFLQENFSEKITQVELDLSEEKEIETIIEMTHPRYREKLKNLLYNIYRRQKGKKENGAKPCRICGVHCYDHELQKNLCFICHRESKEWLAVLKVYFYRIPWLCYKDLKKWLVPPREEMFLYCKEEIRKKYFNRIMKFMTHEKLNDEKKEKALKRLIQRYILLVTEKEPSLVLPEDEFRALKDFAGMIRSLDGGKWRIIKSVKE